MKQPPSDRRDGSGAASGRDAAPAAPRVTVRHEGGRNVLQWAADSARLLALSASQVMRKLDTNSLQLEDEEPPRGQPVVRRGAPMPGGGMNPYENRGAVGRPAAARRDTPRSAAPTRAPGVTAARPPAGVSPRPPAAAPAPTSWWRRLFQRG